MIQMARWDVTDGDKPGQGDPVGFVHTFPTGLIHIKIDGYLTPAALDRLRLQLMAAVNYTKSRPPQ